MGADVLVADETGPTEAPSTAVLIGAEGTILVDTSLGEPQLMAARHLGVSCHRAPDQGLRAVLDGEGYAPGDIDAVVLNTSTGTTVTTSRCSTRR